MYPTCLYKLFLKHFFVQILLSNFLTFLLAIFSCFASYICNLFLSTELTSSYCKTYNLTRKLGFSYVSAGDSFPLTTKKGFSLRAGFENRVAIRAVDIETEPQTRVPSMSFYPDFIQILSRFYLDIHRGFLEH